MQDRPSETALDTLAARAIASLAPQACRILNDPYALRLLPPNWLVQKWVIELGSLNPFFYPMSQMIADMICPGGAVQIALRHRCMDECLLRACKDGIGRTVILGAGYDSRPMRFQQEKMEFVEIDHPLTQKEKCARLAEVLGGPIAGVRYISADFRGEWLGEVMAAGWSPDLTTIFIWEGVGYYLPESAVCYTLECIQRLAPAGSRIVFDMFPQGIADPESNDPVLKKICRYGLERGECFLWGCHPKNMPGFLAAKGFQVNSLTTMWEYALGLAASEHLKIDHAPALELMYVVEAEF